MKALKYALFGTCIGILSLSSCQKETQDWSYSTDDALSQAAFQDVYTQVSETSEGEDNLRSGCATITLANSIGTFPNTVTIDFGTGCTSTHDLRTRKGKIIATYTDRWRTTGSTITIQLEDYEVDGYQVEGSATIVNDGTNSDGQLSYTNTITGGKVTDPNGANLTWEGTRIYTWIEGQNTSFLTDGISGITDDIYSITGQSSGTTRNGNSYTSSITSPLVRKLSCRWLVSGIIEVTPNVGSVRSIDFGNGDCDASATVSIGNLSTTINLLQ